MVELPNAATLTAIARSAGLAAHREFGNTHIVQTKSNPMDFMTSADKLAENIIIKAIRERYPTHSIVSEEAGRTQGTEPYTWYVDPLDGTRNFYTMTPLYGVIMGFAVRDEMQLAAIYMPATGESISATAGRGVFLNDRLIHCSQKESLLHSYGCGPTGFNLYKHKYLERLTQRSLQTPFNMSAFGSCATSTLYTATGQRDWWFGNGGGAWDYAAPSLILREAGCTVTRIDGSPWRVGDGEILAAPPRMHRELVAVLN
jgi:myo-inositol-1(or 4)-monophosphatase